MTGTIKRNMSKRRRIDFELKMPEAQRVILMGDFNQWNPKTHPMCKEENAVWPKTVRIFPGRYEYRFWVDGELYNDPNNTTKCPNNFGTEDNVVEVLS